MSRNILAEEFDQVIELLADAISKPEAEHKMALELALSNTQALKRSAICNCIPSAPSSLTLGLEAGSGDDHKFIITSRLFKRLQRSLMAYCPGRIGAAEGSKILLHLIANTSNLVDPDLACEVASLRYCGVAAIDECSSDAIYIETVLREALGMFGDLPPKPIEVERTKQRCKMVLSILQKTSERTEGVAA